MHQESYADTYRKTQKQTAMLKVGYLLRNIATLQRNTAQNMKTKKALQKIKTANTRPYFFGVIILGALSAAYFTVPTLTPILYDSPVHTPSQEQAEEEEDLFIVTHIDTPSAVKAIYMTQCVAATPSFRNSLVELIEETELNSVVVDIKDYTGTLIFKSTHPLLSLNEGGGCRAADIREFIGRLHDKGIYVIGRITVFQDPFYTTLRPDLAIKKESATTTVWTDYKGLSFIDVGAKDFWDYIVAIGEESYALGYDELNFDYIRFPSDGDMQDIYYPFSEERIVANPDMGKAEILRGFE